MNGKYGQKDLYQCITECNKDKINTFQKGKPTSCLFVVLKCVDFISTLKDNTIWNMIIHQTDNL